jgi:hypothetical protein
VPALLNAHVVPFLGAGYNVCRRPQCEVSNFKESPFLPSGGELSQHLADHFGGNVKDAFDLAHVSQAGRTGAPVHLPGKQVYGFLE